MNRQLEFVAPLVLGLTWLLASCTAQPGLPTATPHAEAQGGTGALPLPSPDVTFIQENTGKLCLEVRMP